MRTERHPLIPPGPGSSCELHSLHFGPSDASRKAVIQAALHADEPPGLLVAWHLRRELIELETQGRVREQIVLLPTANPVGLAQRVLGRGLGRFELASGENFNRNYADLSAGVFQRMQPEIESGGAPTLERLRQLLRETCAGLPAASTLQSLRRTLLSLSADADLVLDLHCDNEAVLHLYTATSLWPRVEPLARLLGARATLLAAESGGEPFDESCSLLYSRLNRLWSAETGRPALWPDACVAVTVELRGEVDVEHDLAERDAGAILAYLAHTGYLDLPLAELPPLAGPALPLEGSMPVLAPHGGVLVHRPLLGRQVQRGQCLADVIDPISAVASELLSPCDGLLYAREHQRVVHAGCTVAKVAGDRAVRSGKLLSA